MFETAARARETKVMGRVQCQWGWVHGGLIREGSKRRKAKKIVVEVIIAQ